MPPLVLLCLFLQASAITTHLLLGILQVEMVRWLSLNPCDGVSQPAASIDTWACLQIGLQACSRCL